MSDSSHRPLIQRFFRDFPIRERLSILTRISFLALILVSLCLVVKVYVDYSNLSGSLEKASEIADAIDNARGAQVHFKKQVQEWKNILLRGSDTVAFQLYLE